MQIEQREFVELANIIAKAVADTLEKRLNLQSANATPKTEKTAYQKTEQLLYNYMGFKRIVAERMREIEELRKYGVPQSCAVKEYVDKGNTVQGLVLEEESVENAVRTVQASVEGTVQAIALIDKCMAALKNDPYYKVLEMRYFEGRTQEDIALTFNCSQVTISNNKGRLVRELAMRLFPNQAIAEMMK